MKGYLYKERICLLPSIAVVAFFYIAQILFTVFFSDGVSLSAVFFIFSLSLMLYRNYAEEKKILWEHYSKAIPVSAYKRIGARFIFVFLSIFIGAAAVFLSSAIIDYIKYFPLTETGFFDWISAFFRIDNTGLMLNIFSLYLLSAGISVSVCCFSKTQTGIAFAMLPYLGTLYIIYVLPFSFFLTDYDNLYDAVFNKNFALCFLAISIILYLAFYFLCVAKEAVIEKKAIKRATVAAAVLFAVGAVLIGGGIFSLNAARAFDKTPEKDRFGYTQEDYISNSEEREKEEKEIDAAVRPVMMSLTNDICGVSLLDKTTAELQDFFKENGYGEYIDDVTENYNFTISYSTYNSSDRPEYPDIVSFSAQVLSGKIYATDYEEKLAEIKRSFAVGVPEEQTVELMKTYGLCPEAIIESYDGERHYRSYRFGFEIYDISEGTSNIHSVYLEVTNGRIYSVDYNF